MRMNLDFGNHSNGKTNSVITYKSLETGKLFGNTMVCVKFHSCLLRLLEFRAVIHWTPLSFIWAPALHLFLPSLTPPPLLESLKKFCCTSASALSIKRCSCLSSWTFPVLVHSTLPWGRCPGQQGMTPKAHRPAVLKQKCSHFLYLQPFLQSWPFPVLHRTMFFLSGDSQEGKRMKM